MNGQQELLPYPWNEMRLWGPFAPILSRNSDTLVQTVCIVCGVGALFDQSGQPEEVDYQAELHWQFLRNHRHHQQNLSLNRVLPLGTWSPLP